MDTDQKQQFTKIISIVVVVSLVFGFIGGYLVKFVPSSYLTKFSTGFSSGAVTSTSTGPQTAQEQTIIKVANDSSPSVVSITISKNVPVYQEYYDSSLGWGGLILPQYQQKGTQKEQVGGGTGFVISSDGMILTNKHVVSDTSAQYTVVLNNGSKYSATVLARDPHLDLAILKINATGLKPLPLGDSSKLQVGQTAISIGNALGEFSNTVDAGVISGLNRSITASGVDGSTETLTNVIQTDAAINSGNSGGPLLDSNGNVIGINVALANNAQGIGFAIPINMAKKDIQEITQKGQLQFPYLGVRYILINQSLAKANNLSVDYGALIVPGSTSNELAVEPGSPADKAGLVENDIILEVNGTQVNQNNDLAGLIDTYNPGDTVTLRVLHKGTTETIKVTLGASPATNS